MLVRTKHVIIENTLIQFPKQDCTYHFKFPALPGGEITITFAGSGLPEITVFDFSTFYFQTLTDESVKSVIYDQISFVSEKCLPPGSVRFPFPMMLFNYNNSNLVAVTNLHVNVDTHVCSTPGILLDYKAECVNDSLQRECVALAGGIPVETGQHPIFKSRNRPNIDFLSHLYRTFWIANKEKLDAQYKNSSGRCHIRAHFISDLLGYYGIDSVKVFKLWNKCDWKAFTNNDTAWRFHCAVMFADNLNQKWVWDPWVGNNLYLLTLKQWLHQKDCPTPIKLVVTNKSIVDDYTSGKTCRLTHGPYFSVYRDTYQQLATSVLFNPPALLLEGTGFAGRFFGRPMRKCKGEYVTTNKNALPRLTLKPS